MRRRDFIAGAAAAALPLAGRAQQRRPPLVGFLRPGSPTETGTYLAAFLQGLKEQGFLEDENVAIEYRFAEGRNERLPALAADLVDRGVAVIVAGGPAATFTAKSATSTIPIVFVAGDPANADFLDLFGSFNRPKGNLTGFPVFDTSAIYGKRLELVRELMPGASSAVMLVDPNERVGPDIGAMISAARSLGLLLSIAPANTNADLETAFVAAAERHADALLVSLTSFFTVRREKIVALAARHAMPTVYAWRDYVAASGLISYGSSLTEVWR